MGHDINVKNIEEAVKSLNHYAKKDRGHFDVRFRNVHLCLLNETIGRTIFRKNDLYVDASTLYELMQPIGRHRSHNSHGLDPLQIINCLNDLNKTVSIIRSHLDRLCVFTSYLEDKNSSMILVIDRCSNLPNNLTALVNKLITIYPKRKVREYLSRCKKEDILYLGLP